MFDADDRWRLLAIARRALEARVRREGSLGEDVAPPLDLPRGAFVSLHRGAHLRGCLGRIEADLAVGRVVAHLAGAVADSDPRFAPVTPDELAALQIEVSVLTPQVEASPGDVEVGRHGLIVEGHGRRGLLLPQVAVGHRWDRLAFLRETCLKAGLPSDAWEQGARLFVFEAQVFGEDAAT
jgi:AmmeMemoRadiSam system protein A